MLSEKKVLVHYILAFVFKWHSLIISREVLILTLSIFNTLDVCISWYSLCPRECTEKYFPRECISRTLPRENVGDTSSRGKHLQCSSNDESSSLMICCRQTKCQNNGCNKKNNTWTLYTTPGRKSFDRKTANGIPLNIKCMKNRRSLLLVKTLQ